MGAVWCSGGARNSATMWQSCLWSRAVQAWEMDGTISLPKLSIDGGEGNCTTT